MIFRRRAVLTLLAALFALALPAAPAAAVTYTVDSLEDQPDKEIGLGDCETAVGTCTLRAAIQELNVSTGANDKIDFDASFQGDPGDTIVPSSPLPSIVHPILIDGDGVNDSRCMNDTFLINGPCIEITAPNASTPALVVDNADGTTIEGLSVTGSRTAINVTDSSSSFVAHGDWLGVKLDGTAGGNTTGIFLDPNSNGATIGGTSAADRNVFGNNGAEGLDIEGADNADVLGNYFGVKPDGSTQAANGKNVEITDTVAFEANDDEVGTTVASGAAPCDGGCNVISGSTGPGIDLVGDGIGQNELPASGPTTVRGNYVGLNSGGVTTVSAGPLFDILAGAAKDVTVGGTAAGDANYIAGGSYGIYQENSNGFQALGNVIGRRPGGAGVAAPGSAGIFLFSLNSTDRETVEDNTIRLDGGAGIEQRFGGADIAGNLIEEGQYGILTKGSPGVAGANLIEGNSILGVEANGILIENDENEVLGNAIFESGGAGIRIQNPAPLLVATENLIGDDTAGDENTISENGGDAIEIVDPVDPSEESTNEVARNNGELNGGLFIDLVEDANEGIKPPAFATSKQAGASGNGAVAGATIRVFRKAGASPGELQSFLAEAIADGSGNWKVTYPASIPGGAIVAATQTSPAGGTSELAIATTSADPGPNQDKGKDKTKEPEVISDPPCAFTAGKCRWPETVITGAPKGKTHAATVKFRFSSDMPDSTFECKLDKKPFKKCRSPKKYKGLKPGKHVFKVRATDTKGTVDPVPAKKKFRVLAATGGRGSGR